MSAASARAICRNGGSGASRSTPASESRLWHAQRHDSCASPTGLIEISKRPINSDQLTDTHPDGVTLLSDLRVAIRHHVQRPAFALTVLVTLALTIGATTAVFAVVEAMLVRGLPFAGPDRLVWVARCVPTTLPRRSRCRNTGLPRAARDRCPDWRPTRTGAGAWPATASPSG